MVKKPHAAPYFNLNSKLKLSKNPCPSNGGVFLWQQHGQPRTKNEEPRTKNQEPGTRNQEQPPRGSNFPP